MTRTPTRPRKWRSLHLAPIALILLGFGCSSADYQMLEHPGEAGATASAELPPAPVVDPSFSETEAYFDESYDFANEGAELSGGERAMLGNMSKAQSKARLEDAPPARDAKGKANEEAKAQSERAAAKAEADKAKDEAPDHGRQIIYVAGLQISVFDLEGAIASVESMPDRYGGWVHSRSQSQVVLRLPAAQLKPAMAELAGFGVVEGRTLQAQDVTAEYVDLDSRIMVLRDTQAQLLELLGDAKTVEEALHVRTALDNVTMELELALGRMRQISDLIAYSTLTVTLVERGPQDITPSSNDPFGWVDRLGVEATEWR